MDQHSTAGTAPTDSEFTRTCNAGPVRCSAVSTSRLASPSIKLIVPLKPLLEAGRIGIRGLLGRVKATVKRPHLKAIRVVLARDPLPESLPIKSAVSSLHPDVVKVLRQLDPEQEPGKAVHRP